MQADFCGLHLRVTPDRLGVQRQNKWNIFFLKYNINSESKVLDMTLTCRVVQFIMWWFWAVHSSGTCWVLWAREELGWNASGARRVPVRQVNEINPRLFRRWVKAKNTGLTGCFSAWMPFNDRWVAVKHFPPFNTKLSVMHYNSIYTLV